MNKLWDELKWKPVAGPRGGYIERPVLVPYVTMDEDSSFVRSQTRMLFSIEATVGARMWLSPACQDPMYEVAKRTLHRHVNYTFHEGYRAPLELARMQIMTGDGQEAAETISSIITAMFPS